MSGQMAVPGTYAAPEGKVDDGIWLDEESLGRAAEQAANDSRYVLQDGVDTVRVETSDPGDLTPGELLLVAPAFRPTDIAGCQAWFDAQALALSDADPVVTWPDLSGFGRDATEGSGVGTNSAGTYDDDGIGGAAAVSFDGSDALTTGAFGVTLTAPVTIFAVAAGTGLSSTKAMVDGIGSSNRNLVFYSASSPGFGMFAGSTVGAVAGDTDPHYFAATYNGASSAFRQDGTEVATGDAGSNTLTGLSIGARYDTNAQWWTGHIGEVIVYSRALTAAEIAQVEAYLANRWGF